MRPVTLRAACLALGCLLFVSLPTSAARACATCKLGDPTLTTFGLGQPFSARLRMGARYTMRTTQIGQDTPDGFLRRGHQVGLLTAFTPLPWLTLDADLPMAHVQVTQNNGAVTDSTNLADASVGARMQVWTRKARGRAHHLWGNLQIGLPTAPRLNDPQGGGLPLEQQTGSGAFVPQLGAGYAFTGGEFSLFITSRADLPSQGFMGSRPARGLFSTLAGQWQPLHWLGLRVGWEHAYEAIALDEGGSEDPDSGGILWSAALGVLLAPAPDWVVSLGAQFPVWQHLRGEHEERPVAMASILYDLGAQ